MGRLRFSVSFSVLVLLVAGFASGMSAEEPDCSRWHIRGIQVGMTVEEATAGREFESQEHPADPPGYLRYISYSKSAPGKVDFHVDVLADPPRVIGVGTTDMKNNMPPQLFYQRLIERWGEPFDVFENKDLTVYTWTSPECQLDARVTVMNRDDVIAVFSAMTSIPGLWELKVRKREARAAAAGEAAAADPAQESPPRGEDEEPAGETDPDEPVERGAG